SVALDQGESALESSGVGNRHSLSSPDKSRSAVPSIENQVGGSYRDQGHGGQAGPLGLPHAALRGEIHRPRSGVLRGSTPTATDQAAQVESCQAGIPDRPSSRWLKSEVVDILPQGARIWRRAESGANPSPPR